MYRNFVTATLRMEGTCAGANISDCRLEAVELALEHNCTVEFTHNDRVFQVSPGKILNAVAQVGGAREEHA